MVILYPFLEITYKRVLRGFIRRVLRYHIKNCSVLYFIIF